MRRVGAQLLLALLLATWLAPAALATYVSPQYSCCRRAAHHCSQSGDQAFRDARLHCQMCRPLVTTHQAPRVSPVAIGITSTDTHPFAHEFSSAFSHNHVTRSQSQRAPPSSER